MEYYAHAYRQACKWNARLIYALLLVTLLLAIVSAALWFETSHPRPTYPPGQRPVQALTPEVRA